MAIRITELHNCQEGLLNSEWMILENSGDQPFVTRNCVIATSTMTKGKGPAKRTELGKLDPGFTLEPGTKVRVITGNPGRKAFGAPPADGITNYFLFLAQPILRTPGLVLSFSLRSQPLVRVVYDPKSPGNVREFNEGE